MTITPDRTANQTAKAAATELAAPPARTTVTASSGSPTTSREPPGKRAAATGDGHAVKNGKPDPSRKPGAARAARFAAVSMAIRIQELATWIAARPNFTFADAAAASAPSPCSPSVMAYTLPDPRLASALAERGYVMTVGGKNGYTVTPLEAPAQPNTTRVARRPSRS